jgi:hypothetical protein
MVRPGLDAGLVSGNPAAANDDDDEACSEEEEALALGLVSIGHILLLSPLGPWLWLGLLWRIRANRVPIGGVGEEEEEDDDDGDDAFSLVPAPLPALRLFFLLPREVDDVKMLLMLE